MSPLLNPDADAGVFDFHTQLFGQNVVFKPHVDAALQRELDRVAEQVDKDLPQAERVGARRSASERVGAHDARHAARGTRHAGASRAVDTQTF